MGRRASLGPALSCCTSCGCGTTSTWGVGEEVVESTDIALDNKIYAQIGKEDFDRWIDCDASLETGPSEFSSVDQIVAEVQEKYGDNVSDDTDEEIEVQEDPISSSEALKHIEGLEKYLMQENNSGDSSADLLALKRIKRHLTSKIPFKPKQSSIERFFKWQAALMKALQEEQFLGMYLAFYQTIFFAGKSMSHSSNNVSDAKIT